MRGDEAAVHRAARRIGSPAGIRILHMTDVHNRAAGMMMGPRLADALAASLVVNTGDVSGIPGPWEAMFIRWFARIDVPYVFVPGNHDDSETCLAMERQGATTICETGEKKIAGLPIWGGPDPNRTRFGRGDPYSLALVKEFAAANRPPTGAIAAVHHESMVAPGACGLVLCGHVHTPKVWHAGGSLYVRPGSSGGGGPLGGPMSFAVIDLDDPTSVRRVWIVSLGADLQVRREI